MNSMMTSGHVIYGQLPAAAPRMACLPTALTMPVDMTAGVTATLVTTSL